MLSSAEVMPWKGNGALLFPPSALKHKWLDWLMRIKGGRETTWNCSWHSLWAKRGSERYHTGTMPLAPILSFVRTQALWVKDLLCFQQGSFKRTMSHWTIWRWAIGKRRLQFYDRPENGAWKAWLHSPTGSFWHHLSGLKLNKVGCHSETTVSNILVGLKDLQEHKVK